MTLIQVLRKSITIVRRPFCITPNSLSISLAQELNFRTSLGVETSQKVVEQLLECLEIGESCYEKFVVIRLQSKKHLQDAIFTNRKTVSVKFLFA